MASRPKKIIMVEDDMAMREIIRHKLTVSGFEIKTAEDGKKGLALIFSEQPDLVILDLMMPGMSGFQVLEQIRSSKDKSIASIPIIVMSNLWSNEDIFKAKSFNVQAYLVKAYFTPNEIVEKINEVLADPSMVVS